MSTRLELLKRYLNEDPSDSFLIYAIALEYIGMNNHIEAFEQFQTLLNQDPDYLAAYYMAGKTAEVLNMLSIAKDFYRKGIEVAIMQKEIHALSELRSALEFIDEYQ